MADAPKKPSEEGYVPKRRSNQANRQRGKRGRESKIGSTVSRQHRAEILARRAKVAELYLQCWTQKKIAAELGVSEYCISKDLDAIHEAWKAHAVEDIHVYKMRELERVNIIEREVTEQWERSKLNAESVTTEEVALGGGVLSEAQDADERENRAPTKIKTQRVSKGQCGDPRYAQIRLDCLDKRAKLLGLYAPVKVGVEESLLKQMEDAGARVVDRLARIAAGGQEE